MQIEIIMQKLSQIFFLSASGVIYLLNQMDVTLIEKAFDQLLSLGFLCVACYLMYREWQKGQEYNKERDERLEELVRNNTDALNSFRDEMRNIHRRIDKNEKDIARHEARN